MRAAFAVHRGGCRISQGMDAERNARDRLVIVRGDLAREEADVLVNAANSALAGGGGVDGALHRAAGPELLEECRRLHPFGCPTGEVRVTRAFGLRARWVLHAVGPVWSGGGAEEAELLASCYRRSIELARDLGARSVAFPAISSGVYGYPWELAADVAIATLARSLPTAPAIEEVRLVLFSEPIRAVFEAARARCTRGDANPNEAANIPPRTT